MEREATGAGGLKSIKQDGGGTHSAAEYRSQASSITTTELSTRASNLPVSLFAAINARFDDYLTFVSFLIFSFYSISKGIRS